MRSVLLKEWLLMKSQKSILVMFLAFSLLGGIMAVVSADTGGLFAIIAVYYVASLSLSLEYKYSGERFMIMLSASRGDIVRGKFAFLGLISAASLVLSLIGAVIYRGIVALAGEFALAAFRSGGIVPNFFPVGSLLMGMSLALGIGAAVFCSYFLLGYRNSRWVNFFIFFFPMTGLVKGVLGKAETLEGFMLFAGNPVAVGTVLGVAVAVFVVAGIVSSLALRRKDLSLPLGDIKAEKA